MSENRTPLLALINGPAPVREWDDNDYSVVFGPDKGVGLVPLGDQMLPANALAPGSIPRAVTDVLAERPRSVTDFGAVADWDGATGTSIATAVTAAFAASSNLYFPPGDYYVAGNTTINLTDDAIIDFRKARLFFAGTASLSINNASDGTTTLSGAIVKTATTLAVASATGIVAGTILRLFENTVAESNFGSKRNAIAQVRSVSGTTLTLCEPIGMPFADGSTVTIWTPRRLVLHNPNVYRYGATLGAGTPGYDGMLQVARWHGMQIQNLVISSNQAYSATGEQDGNGIHVSDCLGANISDVTMANVSYGITIPNSRNTVIRGIDAQNVRHPVVPGTWSRQTRIENVRARDCYATVDSHAAFETHYRDVRAYSDTGMESLRCVGGSLVDADITTSAVDATPGPYWNNLTLTAGHTDFYADAWIEFERVRILSPARTESTIGCPFGRIRARDVIANSGSGAFASTGVSLEVSNCRNQDRTPWHADTMRVLPSISYSPLLDAELLTGTYHIDPRKSAVPHTARFLRCHGMIVTPITVDATVLPIKIYTSCWSGIPNPPRVQGQIRIFGICNHGSTGNVSQREKAFWFRQKITATSAVIMPLVANYVSDRSGIANDTFEITIDTPTQQGATELGSSNDSDYAVLFNLNVTSGGLTTPSMHLWYQLEMLTTTP